MSREHDPSDASANTLNRIRRAMAMLRSEHDGDRGVVEIVACGIAAVPVLREFALRRDSSGLYYARCRAVEALAALGAQEALRDLLYIPLDRPDPVERTGDEAVINAAARALIGRDDEDVFQTLQHLARHKHLTGVIEALGASGRPEAIPRLIDALIEDCSRPIAETALQSFGARARAPLWEIARRPDYSVSERRRRRSALRLLLAIGVPPTNQVDVVELQQDADLEIRILANRLMLTRGTLDERREAADMLITLLAKADWRLTMEIEAILIEHAALTATLVYEHLSDEIEPAVQLALRRVEASLQALGTLSRKNA